MSEPERKAPEARGEKDRVTVDGRLAAYYNLRVGWVPAPRAPKEVAEAIWSCPNYASAGDIAREINARFQR